MTSRERILRALEFRSPDRAPRNLWTLPWVEMFAGEELAKFLREFPDDFAVPADRWERPAVRRLRELLAPGSALRAALAARGFPAGA